MALLARANAFELWMVCRCAISMGPGEWDLMN